MRYLLPVASSIGLSPRSAKVCVADRENGRVQCFDMDGEFVKTVKPPEFGSRIFSTAYTKANGTLAHRLLQLQT